MPINSRVKFEMSSDESALMARPIRRSRELVPFVICKVVPYLLYSLPDVPSASWLFFVFLLNLADIFLCSFFFAYELAGVTWTVKQWQGNLKDLIEFKFKPEPFTAAVLDMNVFWFVSIGVVFIWVIPMFVNLLKLRLFTFLTLGTIAALQGFSLFLYGKSMLVARHQGDEYLRNLLLTATSSEREEFAEAASFDDDSR